MKLDLLNSDGDLDRGKVNARVKDIVDQARDCPTFALVDRIEEELIELIDTVVDIAFLAGQ
jgi:hypothetical protein